ncbi:MAG TPA: hypothetical protein VGN96_06390 [Roseococcus sp.]|jgi:hypothetical protein|nr:hypothetical protein [Roseococcus sp.]
MLAKLTAKNQLTLPKRVVEALDNPTHFEIQVHKGALILWPGRVVSLERQAATAGIPPDVLREAQRLLAERKAREGSGRE